MRLAVGPAKKFVQCEVAHIPLVRRAPFLGRHRLGAEAVCGVEEIMSRTDLWWWNAARVEIDHRSREARLRLEQLERLLMQRVLPTRSRPSWVLYRLGPRPFGGGREQGRSPEIAPTGARHRQSRDIPTEVCIGGVMRRTSAA